MSVEINPEEQLNRIDVLFQKLESLKGLDKELLQRRPSKKSWATLEVIKHMTIAHKVYEPKIEQAIKNSNKLRSINGLKCSAIPSFLIKRFPPQGEKKEIKFKMKTLKKFNPLLNLENCERNEVMSEFSACLLTLKQWITHYNEQKTSLIKFNSAIGPLVRFNVPEACEFILCHNERHLRQIENTIDILQK